MKRLINFGVADKAIHRRSFVPAILLVIFSLTLTTAVSAAELVVNGGFEDPIVDTDLGWTTYYGENQPLSEPGDCPTGVDDAPAYCNDDDRVPGWSVFWTDDLVENEQLNPGRLEIQTGTTGGWPAYNGTAQKAELDSHHRVGNDNTNVTIAQFLPTCPLTAYTLSYAWKSRTEISGDNDVRVIVGSKRVNMHAQNDDWQKETVYFISDNADETLLLFGSIGDETTTGMFLDEVSVDGPDGSESEDCPPVLMDCDNTPLNITLRYDGNDDIKHNQSGNEVIITPETVNSYPDPATIKVYGHKKKDPELLKTYTDVAIGDFFTVKGPRKRIPPRLTFEIYNPKDDLTKDDPVQTITFHTSCSQPLDAGDEFGAITVWSSVTGEVNKITPTDSAL